MRRLFVSFFNRARIDKVIHKDASTYTVPRLTCIDVGIFSISTLYMLLFLICSILSLAFRGYFYSFCLLFIIVNNDILKRVLRAVTKNGMLNNNYHNTLFLFFFFYPRDFTDLGCCARSDCSVHLCCHFFCFSSQSLR